MSAIKPHQPLVAPAPILAAARANCAARLRSRGDEAEAERFDLGDRDDTWAMRHEVRKLQSDAVGTEE